MRARRWKLYKLTDQNLQTHGGFQWTPGAWREANGQGDLCGPGWLHAYTSPLVAAFLNPIHANFAAPRLWQADGAGRRLDDAGLKVGVTKLRLVRELPLVSPNVTQRAAFAILCALEVYKDPTFVAWAQAWLRGEDRTAGAARAAEAAVWAAARAAAWAAAGDARAAVWAAARAVAEAAEAARAAAWAAEAAGDARAAVWAAAEAAAWAVAEAAKANKKLALHKIAREALRYV